MWTASARKFESDCTCFPCRPHFRTAEELHASESVTCPLHGGRFTEHEPLDFCPQWYVVSSRPDDHAPEHIKPQYKKAWLAGIPNGYLSVKDESSAVLL